MTKEARPIIELENVSFRFPAQSEPLLRGVSFSVRRGEWIAIIGANGSGKSTLIRLIAGLLPASSGAIRIDDMIITPETIPDIRSRIGMVFQNPDNQFIGMTVADDIVFGLENRRVPREEMDSRLGRVAARFQIADLLDRHPSKLSGGQKQRVAIASVLALEPQIVLFDEATSMLDEPSKRLIIETMKSLRQSGNHTLLSVTHDHDEMLAADRLIAMEKGRIIADGSPEQLLRDDEVRRRCRIREPFALQVSRALRNKGFPAADAVTETELVEALWAFVSSK